MSKKKTTKTSSRSSSAKKPKKISVKKKSPASAKSKAPRAKPASGKGKAPRPDTGKITRFAHPFYTNTPPAKRAVIPGAGKQMTNYVATKLLPIPPPQRNPPIMTLSEIIGDTGVSEIETVKSISFHAAGDTGEPHGNTQEMVASAMAADYNISRPENSPAFFLHLGDVNYFDNTPTGYQAQFYSPYKKYPGKIIAVPGNHDGETFDYKGASVGQTTSLEAFLENFCQPKPGVPPAAGTIYREMISQPGVYWLMDGPLIDIIGLYSNIGEGPGFISGQNIGNDQKNWFTQTLKDIATKRKQGERKALIVAVHHPPLSSGHHGSSIDMLKDIDDSCTQAGIVPDAFLAGHAHSYQRYTRNMKFNNSDLAIPFIVAGTGGRTAQPVGKADGSDQGGYTFDKSLRGYGYLLVTANTTRLSLEFFQVDVNSGKSSSFDKVVVDLVSGRLI